MDRGAWLARLHVFEMWNWMAFIKTCLNKNNWSRTPPNCLSHPRRPIRRGPCGHLSKLSWGNREGPDLSVTASLAKSHWWKLFPPSQAGSCVGVGKVCPCRINPIPSLWMGSSACTSEEPVGSFSSCVYHSCSGVYPLLSRSVFYGRVSPPQHSWSLELDILFHSRLSWTLCLAGDLVSILVCKCPWQSLPPVVTTKIVYRCCQI